MLYTTLENQLKDGYIPTTIHEPLSELYRNPIKEELYREIQDFYLMPPGLIRSDDEIREDEKRYKREQERQERERKKREQRGERDHKKHWWDWDDD